MTWWVSETSTNLGLISFIFNFLLFSKFNDKIWVQMIASNRFRKTIDDVFDTYFSPGIMDGKDFWIHWTMMAPPPCAWLFNTFTHSDEWPLSITANGFIIWCPGWIDVSSSLSIKKRNSLLYTSIKAELGIPSIDNYPISNPNGTAYCTHQ